MIDGLTIKSMQSYRGKETEWEFLWKGGKWYGRKVDDPKPHHALTTTWIIRASQAALEQSIIVDDSHAVVEKKIEDAPNELLERIKALEALAYAEPDPIVEKPKPPVHLSDDDISEGTIVSADYYDFEFLGRQAHDVLVMHRVHVGGSRYYAVKYRDSDGNWGRTEFYAGVTSVCDMVLGYDDGLLEWACGFGSYKEYKAALNVLAGMGTFSHGMFAKSAMGELPAFDTPDWDSLVRHLIVKQGYRWEDHFHAWNNFIRKAILSFKKWVHRRNVVFHAIEIPLGMRHHRGPNGDKVHGYFAQLDFLVTMDAEDYPDDPKPKRISLPEKPKNGRKPTDKAIDAGTPYVALIPATRVQGDSWAAGDGEWHPREIDFGTGTMAASEGYGGGEVRKCLEIPQTYIPYEPVESIVRERCLAIVDFKSGKNSYPSHALQLQLQVALLRENFPHLDLSRLKMFNLHVTDWMENEAPTFGYSLREKTNVMARTALKYLDIWRTDHARELPNKLLFVGDANIGTPASDNVKIVEYADYFDEKFIQAVKGDRIKAFIE